MTKLSDIFYLNRAGLYSDPLNSNARLPIVYGDLTDGSNGIWELPSINDGSNVYCFASHAVRPRFERMTIDVQPTDDWEADDVITGQTSGTTAIIVEKLTATTYTIKQRDGHYTGGEIIGVTGNADKLADQGVLYPQFDNSTITIYEDGDELDHSLYTFDEDNDYEGNGSIAIITFSSPKNNAIITARGQGKVSTGTTLMENIIDIVDDFLTVENDFTSSLYESTAKSTASTIFNSQSYEAAGVIIQDVSIWETIVSMMASFLGSAYLNGAGELVLDIDINTIPEGETPEIITKGDAYLSDAKLKRENIINQCPCSYAYNYVNYEFSSHTDDSSHVDSISQDIFGVRTPYTPYQYYWCRDLTSVQTVQDLIVTKLKNPFYEIEITDNSFRRIGVDIGDFITYSVDSLYDEQGIQLFNNFWKVTAVRPSKNKIIFRAMATSYFLTKAYLLDGSFTLDGSVKLGGDREMTEY